MKKLLSFILIALALGSLAQPLLVSAEETQELHDNIQGRINILGDGIQYLAGNRTWASAEDWRQSRQVFLTQAAALKELLAQADPSDEPRLRAALENVQQVDRDNPLPTFHNSNVSFDGAMKVATAVEAMLGPERARTSGFTGALVRAGGAEAREVTAKAGNISQNDVLPTCTWSLTEFICPVARIIAWTLAVPVTSITTWAAGIANSFFNILIKYTVLDFAKYGNSDAVKAGWVVARNLVNIFLIFIILYIAISIILQLGVDAKRVLTRVVVVALLVNFSAFFTGVVIDTSNIIATQFYYLAGKNTQTPPGGQANDIVTQLQKGMDLSMATLKLPENTAGKSTVEVLVGMLPIIIGKISLNLITAIIMFFSAMMFITRLVSLIVVIVLSPLAFMFYILPNTEKYWQMWTRKLIEQAFFAPAFFLMFYITVQIANQESIKGIAQAAKVGAGTNIGFANSLIYVLIINGMLVASLLVAKSMGASGANAGLGALNKLGAFTRGALVGSAAGAGVMALRNSVGRASYNLANSEGVKSLVANNSLIGRGLKNIGEFGSKAKFGGSKGSSFKEQVDAKVKLGTDYFKGDPVRQAQYMASLERGIEGTLGSGSAAQQALYKKLSAEDKIKVDEEIEKRVAKARGSVASKNELEYDLNNLDKENQAIINWYNSTPAAVKLAPNNAEQLQKYNSYMKTRKELEARAKTAESEAEEVEQAKSRAARPWTKVGAVLKKLQDRLSEKEQDGIKKAKKDKERDARIKELRREKDAGVITQEGRIELAELVSEKASNDAGDAKKKSEDGGKKDDEGGDDNKKGGDKK